MSGAPRLAKSRSYQRRWTLDENDFELEELALLGSEHGEPPEGAWCMATSEDLTSANYCEYQTAPSGSWHASGFGAESVRRLICTQFADFVRGVRTATCEADLRKRLERGPPLWLEDQYGLPLPEGDTHVCRVWFAADGKEYSAKLRGGVDGTERDALWSELKAFTPLPRSENRDRNSNLLTEALTNWSRSIQQAFSRASRGSGASTVVVSRQPTSDAPRV